MKFKAERATLLKALAHIQSVAEKRNTIPILANARIEVSAGGAERSPRPTWRSRWWKRSRRPRPATASTTAPAATLYEIVRKLPDGADVELDLNTENGQLRLRAGKYGTNLVTLPVEDFPGHDGRPTAASLQDPWGAQALRGLIDRTRFAISTEETRYYLNGIYLHAAAGDAVARSCGRSRRTATAWPAWRSRCPTGPPGMPGVIIPRKTVAELRKLIDEESGEIQIGLSDTRIQFTAGPGDADEQADRRHLPRVRTRDPEGQRQGAARRG